MTMLDIMKERVPAGMEIAKVSEKVSRYDLVFAVDGGECKASLPKACAPGKANAVVDFAICTAMMDLHFRRGDLENAKLWLAKQNELMVQE